MHPVKKKLLYDEANHPVAVQVDYSDWLEIEKQLDVSAEPDNVSDLSQLRGLITLTEDPLEFQHRIRNEWQ